MFLYERRQAQVITAAALRQHQTQPKTERKWQLRRWCEHSVIMKHQETSHHHDWQLYRRRTHIFQQLMCYWLCWVIFCSIFSPHHIRIHPSESCFCHFAILKVLVVVLKWLCDVKHIMFVSNSVKRNKEEMETVPFLFSGEEQVGHNGVLLMGVGGDWEDFDPKRSGIFRQVVDSDWLFSDSIVLSFIKFSQWLAELWSNGIERCHIYRLWLALHWSNSIYVSYHESLMCHVTFWIQALNSGCIFLQ